MLYLDPNKEKVLTFEVDMSGDACDEITSHVRLYVEDVELGFPAELKENKIRALIKPLRTLVKFPLRSGTLIEARLDILSKDQDFYSPWQGEIEIKSSFTVEATLVEDNRPKKSSDKYSVKAILEEEFEQIKEDVKKPQPVKKVVAAPPKPVAKPKPIQEVKKVVAPPKPAPKPVAKSGMTTDVLKKITKEGVLEYMNRAGSKNPTIQEIIYEQAIKKAGSGEPFKVLKEVVKILSRKSDAFSPDMFDAKMMEKMSKKHDLNKG